MTASELIKAVYRRLEEDAMPHATTSKATAICCSNVECQQLISYPFGTSDNGVMKIFCPCCGFQIESRRNYFSDREIIWLKASIT